MLDRYQTKEMKDIWDEANYYKNWIEIEAASLVAAGEENLAARLRKLEISPEEIRESEAVSGHELNSFLSIIAKRLGSGSEAVHKGLTSSDVMDTARVMQLKDSIRIIEKKLDLILEVLLKKANLYKDTIMCGRTHGQLAEPISLGLKFARYYSHFKRNIKRLQQAKSRILLGKINGAVGTYSLISPEHEIEVLDMLGLQASEITSQVIPRDNIAEYVFVISLIAASAEEIALEIRLLSQDGIKELAEPFGRSQKGSSAMPHKKNPVLCEKICGLSRLVKNNTSLALSNIALWNERDISHSSNERIMLEESSSLSYYILDKLEYVLKNLTVYEENIKANFLSAGKKMFSSGVLKLLLDKACPREEAYSKLKELFQGPATVAEIKELLHKDYKIDLGDLELAFSAEYYLNGVDIIYKRLGI